MNNSKSGDGLGPSGLGKNSKPVQIPVARIISIIEKYGTPSELKVCFAKRRKRERHPAQSVKIGETIQCLNDSESYIIQGAASTKEVFILKKDGKCKPVPWYNILQLNPCYSLETVRLKGETKLFNVCKILPNCRMVVKGVDGEEREINLSEVDTGLRFT